MINLTKKYFASYTMKKPLGLFNKGGFGKGCCKSFFDKQNICANYSYPYLSFYSLRKSFFSTNSNTDSVKGESGFRPETINKENEKLLMEFEEMLATKEDNSEKRIKLLSIKLLQTNSSDDIIQLFEEKYIKGLLEKIYAEELCLFLYFFVSLKEKEMLLSQELKDSRIEVLLRKIYEQMNEMDFTNILVLTWSCSLLISKFKFHVPIELRLEVLMKLPETLDLDKKAEIPTLCFGISSFFDKSDKRY